jgi:membrane-associated phospholipid phosphatase
MSARGPVVGSPDQAVVGRRGWEGSSIAGVLVAAFVASTALFAKLAEAVAAGEPIVHLDSAVAAWLHAHATGFATTALSGVTRLGGTEVLLGVTLLAAVALLLRRRLADAALIGAALAGGQVLNWALKAAFERPRPQFPDPLATAAGFSFPSGHAMVSLTVYGALAFVVAGHVESRRARAWILVSALALVLAIGFSRVYLGVHYVSDVLAAYSAGLAWLAVCALGIVMARRRDEFTGLGSSLLNDARRDQGGKPWRSTRPEPARSGKRPTKSC